MHPKYAIISIVVLAVLLRCIQINNPYVEGYGWREADMAMMAENLYKGKTNLLSPMVNYEGEGPNYRGFEFQTVTYLTSRLYGLFGVNEWSGRVVSLLFGVMGLLSIYGLVREVWDRQRALLAALILAILPGSVYLDRTFVPDPAMLALLSFSLYTTVRYIRTKTMGYFLLAALAGCLGVLTKINGAVLIIPGIYVLIKAWKSGLLGRRELMAFLMILFLVAGIVISYYLWAWHLSLEYPPYHFSGSGKFISMEKLGNWIWEKYFLSDLYKHLVRSHWSGPVLLLFILGLVSPAPTKKTFHRIFHYWVLALAVQFVYEAEHLASDPNNMMLYFPPAAVFSANFLYQLYTNFLEKFGREAARGILATGLLVIAASSFSLLHVLFRNTYLDHASIGTKLKELASEKDLAISLDEKPIVLYYSGLNGWTFPPLSKASDKSFHWHTQFDPEHIKDDLAVLKGLQDMGARWLVIPDGNSYLTYSNLEVLKCNTPTVYDFLNRHYDVVYQDASGVILRGKGGAGAVEPR
jgi:hypothetical protein